MVHFVLYSKDTFGSATSQLGVPTVALKPVPVEKEICLVQSLSLHLRYKKLKAMKADGSGSSVRLQSIQHLPAQNELLLFHFILNSFLFRF